MTSSRFLGGMLCENETGVRILHHHSAEHTKRAWEFFRKLGSPKFWIAPMVDQSELPFRMLCRKYGATGAYTPMLHAKIFSESEKYRNEEFTTCAEDRPLLAQFCANDPEYLVAAGRLIQHQVDAIDLNLGCPQRIARKGKYGAFLMEDLDLVERIVSHAVQVPQPKSLCFLILKNAESECSYNVQNTRVSGSGEDGGVCEDA